ncbi:putative ATPase synthesis protein 25, mitochondrial [Fusarium austroafricanum]|uniref:ATPase synthesis protein 25 n=1 Tax=Fusarium austroafricanum TaxID=2364996 RepID=A0A8H4JDZ5_9HYPO|nr:putative ATPase synthesis protein 25, mitochondrial [Fusarium austroafricanum]
MLTRPVAAALGCRQCQSAIIRAVVSRPATSSFRSLPQTTSRRLPLATRFYSDAKTNDPIIEKESSTVVPPSDAANATLEVTESDDVPWFLEVEPPRHPDSQHAVELPKIPEGAPEVLEPMVKYIFEDMGLDEISLLDMRDLDPPAALGPNLIMLFATARSERHLHISSGRFVRWLRKNYNISARADGLIGPGELRTKLRRLRKKAKLMGTNTAIIPGGDNGISTGWVCVNFSSNGDNIDEAAKVDDSGRFSGFGAPQTGTTVVVQCMTESRRTELDLETLWQGVLKKSLRENKQARGEKINSPEELEELLASKVQIPKSESAQQWQALQKASQQRRYYTTSARRLSPDVAKHENLNQDETFLAEEKEAREPLDDAIKRFNDIQLVGMPLSQEQLYQFLRDAMTAPMDDRGAAGTVAGTRLAFVDQILLTAEERGMVIWTDAMFFALIEAGLASPSYNNHQFKRAHENLEQLMVQKGCRFTNGQIDRLMTAYAKVGDWPRYWDTFRMPSLWKRARTKYHYMNVFNTLAATNDQIMCIENLRWVYDEMMNGEKRFLMVDDLYESLKACIRVADPAAEFLIKDDGTYFSSLKHYSQRRFLNREYLNMLREVEADHVKCMEFIAQQNAGQVIEDMAKK